MTQRYLSAIKQDPWLEGLHDMRAVNYIRWNFHSKEHARSYVIVNGMRGLLRIRNIGPVNAAKIWTWLDMPMPGTLEVERAIELLRQHGYRIEREDHRA